MPTIMLSCGEPSGDLYAGALARAVRALDPTSSIFGFGGDHLRAAGARLVGDYRGIAVTGLVEAVRVIPRSLALYRRLVAAARATPPDVFVAVDFPDFNFRLAGAMRRLGVPVLYYVSPQLWAWRRGRLRTMRRLADRVLVIFPFEVEMYRGAGIPVEFVGHPLLDLARAREPRASFLFGLGLDPDAPVVALLPGSRPNEVRAILPGLLDAAAILARRHPNVQFTLARASNLDPALFDVSGAAALPLTAVEGRTDDVLGAADVAITASGTATVQAAIHECPMVIVYRLSPLTYHLGKRFVHVDTYGMVNLVAGRRIVPELIQGDFVPERVADAAGAFLTDPALARATREALRAVIARLGETGASDRAARAVLAMAGGAADGSAGDGSAGDGGAGDGGAGDGGAGDGGIAGRAPSPREGTAAAP